jgi:hypothetical protein
LQLWFGTVLSDILGSLSRPLQLRVLLQRLAYFPQEAAKELSKFSLMVAIDARLPVAMFGYK